MLIFKSAENKNYVKSSLITEFIFNLNSFIDLKNEPSYKKHKVCTPSINTNKLLKRNVEIGSAVTPGTMPCVNIECRWLQFLTYFYSHKLGYWSLPAVTQEDHCEICRLINTTDVKFSDIQISKDMIACVNGKKLM